jgi:aminoglycoside phosphotransferase (APT) family kinase protein
LYGRSGQDELINLDRYKQYELGIEAGLNLKLIHCCPIPPRQQSSWADCQVKRWRIFQDAYRCRRHKIAYEQKIFSLIKNYIPLLVDRPQRLLHGGFHTDNIVLSYECSLSLIDFDSWQYGDPLFDLANVLTRIRHVSLPYAIGILDCYFAFEISDYELRLLTLYGAMDLIEQVVAARTKSNEAIETALERVQVFLRDLQGCKNICPSWYKRMRCSPKARQEDISDR